MSIFYITALAIGIFFLSYGWFLQCDKKTPPSSAFLKLIKQPFAPFLVLGFLGCFAVYLIVPDQKDAIYPVSYTPFLTFFAVTFALFLIMNYTKSAVLHFILLLAACLLNIFLLPAEFNFSNGLMPIYAERLILAISWCAFAWFYHNLNGVDGVLSIQSLSVVLGLFLMFMIGIMPELYSGWNMIFTALLLALMIFTNYPSSLTLDKKTCCLIGFLIGWLSILATIEGNGACVLIINMYYIYEVLIAAIKKLNFQTQFKILMNNMFYNQLAAVGIPPKSICEFIGRVNLILLLLAGFQIYSPNQYTIVLISFFAVFLIISRVTSPQNSEHHLLLAGNIVSLIKKNRKTKDSK